VALENSLNKIPWVIIFAMGVQFHFIAIIIPEIRDYNIHVFGMGLAVISASIILILYIMSRRRQEKTMNLETRR